MPNALHIFREAWKRIILRRLQFRDKHSRLELLYKIEDPWGMAGEKEQFRFRETNKFLKAQAPNIAKLLEVGCGEGHQTEAFQSIAERVYGIDVSESAVARAAKRCPKSSFLAGDLTHMELPSSWTNFDVVTACEVLYYMSDIPGAISAMERRGGALLVTYVDSYKHRLDPIILSMPNLKSARISFDDTQWTMAYWPSRSPYAR